MLSKINSVASSVATHHIPEQAKPVVENRNAASGEKQAPPAPAKPPQIVHTVDRMRRFDSAGTSTAASSVERNREANFIIRYGQLLAMLPRYASGEHISSLKQACPGFSDYFADNEIIKNSRSRYFWRNLNSDQHEMVRQAFGERQVLNQMLSKDRDFELRKNRSAAQTVEAPPPAMAENSRSMPVQPENFSVLDSSFFEGAREEWDSVTGFKVGERPASVAATDVVDVENYQSQAAVVSVAQRLSENPWLRDDDLLTCMRAMESQLQHLPGAGLLKMVDPLQVSLLLDQDTTRRDAALKRLVGPDQPPVLFLPVNHGNTHWSLMVVARQAEGTNAYHYDSISAEGSVASDNATFKTNRQILNDHRLKYVMRGSDEVKFRQAEQVAQLLGAGRPEKMPMAQQRDKFSCGSYVLSGVYALASAVAENGVFEPKALGHLRPDHSKTIAFLAHIEQQDDAQLAGTAALPPERHSPEPGFFDGIQEQIHKLAPLTLLEEASSPPEKEVSPDPLWFAGARAEWDNLTGLTVRELPSSTVATIASLAQLDQAGDAQLPEPAASPSEARSAKRQRV